MGVGYWLVNNTKKEKITYLQLSAEKARELSGIPVTSAITTWYLLKNSGDKIGFAPDQGKNPFGKITTDIVQNYVDVTDHVIDELIQNGILRDEGIEVFEDEPNVLSED